MSDLVRPGDDNDIVAEISTTMHALGPTDVLLVSFDIEGTGPSPVKNWMPSFGAVAMAASDTDKRVVLGRFRGQMKIPADREWEERTEREFWDRDDMKEAKARALRCTTEPEDVMRAFVKWVMDMRDYFVGSDDSRRVRFLTDASYYDAGWMSIYLMQYADHYPMHTFFSEPQKSRFKPVIDTNAVFRGVAGATTRDELQAELDPEQGWFSSSKAARTALGVPKDEVPTAEHDHNPVNDAQNIIEQYMIVMKYAEFRKHKK